MEEKSLTKIKDKDKKTNIIKKFKKRCLISGLNTLILIAILVAVFVVINLAMRKWSPTPIDFSSSKEYSLTEESKKRVKDIEKDVNIYFVGFDENDKSYKLAKQYNQANNKIKISLVDIAKNIELAKKYNLTKEDPSVVVESGKSSRTISVNDLETYDANYSTVDVTEQKITSAILNVTSDKIAKVYFLTGYTEFNLDTNLISFANYLKDEVLNYENLNILNKKKVPDDCDTLVIMTPNKDFDDLTRDAILNYIKKGGNILWFNGVYEKEQEFKNVNKVLAQYGVNRFEKGVVYETDTDKVFGYVTCFSPTVTDTEILADIQKGAAILFNATKINIDTDNLDKIKVEETDLMTSSEKSYYTKDLTSNFNQKNDEKGSFVVGTKLVKTISEAKEEAQEVTSTLIIYGNDYFISDYPVQIMEGYEQTVFSLLNNKDAALNSIAYLTNNNQDITIRKNYSDSETTFTASDKEKKVIIAIIFAVPIVIIILGIVIWTIRRRRN